MDIIQGVVVEVIDNDTFEMEVTHESAKNSCQYQSTEHIKLHKNVAGVRALDQNKKAIEKKFLGENILCRIEGKNNLGFIVAGEIELLR